MPRPKPPAKPATPRSTGTKRGSSYALSPAAHAAIDRIVALTGVSKASAIEMALRFASRLDDPEVLAALSRAAARDVPDAPAKKSTPGKRGAK